MPASNPVAKAAGRKRGRPPRHQSPRQSQPKTKPKKPSSPPLAKAAERKRGRRPRQQSQGHAEPKTKPKKCRSEADRETAALQDVPKNDPIRSLVKSTRSKGQQGAYFFLLDAWKLGCCHGRQSLRQGAGRRFLDPAVVKIFVKAASAGSMDEVGGLSISLRSLCEILHVACCLLQLVTGGPNCPLLLPHCEARWHLRGGNDIQRLEGRVAPLDLWHCGMCGMCGIYMKSALGAFALLP